MPNKGISCFIVEKSFGGFDCGKPEKKLGIRVLIKNKKNNSGSIVFDYRDLDQLNRLIEIIKSNY